MKQQRKFENKKILSIGNIGQRSIYFGLIISTILIMLIGKSDLAIVNRISLLLTDLSAPVIATISRQTQIIGDSFVFLKNTTSLRKENRSLYEENLRLKKFEIMYQIYESENLVLKNQLNLIPLRVPNFKTVRAISAPGNVFAHSMLLNAGHLDGIEKGNAVLFNGIFIGQILKVGKNSSRVLLISDINSKIPIVVSNNRIPSILTGENLVLPSLQFLPNNVKIDDGSIVQTSGHGGLLPAGIPIGFTVNSPTDKIYVRPVIDLNLIDYVQVLLWRADGVELSDKINGNYFKPLNSEDNSNFLEGLTSRGNRN